MELQNKTPCPVGAAALTGTGRASCKMRIAAFRPEVNAPAVCLGLLRMNGLTYWADFGKVRLPNQTSRNRRLSLAQQGEKVLSAQTAVFHTYAGSVSGGKCVHIDRVATSSFREGWRLRLSRGALLPCLFLYPESSEVCPMSDFSSKEQKYVSPYSLPRCMMFLNKSDALEAARELALFLRDCVYSMNETASLYKENRHGLWQCFSLLLDELDIAAGDYMFPLCGKHDDPDLCPNNRREDADDKQHH